MFRNLGQALWRRLGTSGLHPTSNLACANWAPSALWPHTNLTSREIADSNTGFWRGLWASVAALEAISVEVPQLGDSISEGSIAAVLRSPGDALGPDDVIAQIETDKVTIDVRSPFAGVLEQLSVQEGATVAPGQIIAVVNTTTGSQAAPEATRSPTQEPEVPASGTEKPTGCRISLLKFPPRRTPTGEIISAMPAAEAQRWIAELTGTVTEVVSTPEPAQQPPVTIQGGWPSTAGRRYPARQTIPEHEMEAILLGGAEP